jgi:hypothetical protein
MGAMRRYPLRAKIRIAAGIVLLLASLAEIAGLMGAGGCGVEKSEYVFFALTALVGASLIFLNVRYTPYAVLPVALTIFFYMVYRTASTSFSLCTAVSGVFFLVSAVLCFMLIRAHKI